MDAIVEVETSFISVQAVEASAVVGVIENLLKNLFTEVSTSAVAPSIGGCSISAVAPDYSNGKELALAGA